MTSFDNRYSFEQRCTEASKILAKYPDKIPVIVEVHASCKDPDFVLDKHKYLTPSDLTASQFQYVIRKRMKLSAEKAIFLFVNGTIIPPSSATMADLYTSYASDDKFLRMKIHTENTFG